MRFEQLEYLLSLKETGSISRTAEKMLISHQAVSKAIKSLEDDLSVTLLNRSAHGVTLTAAGLETCNFAEKIFLKKTMFLQNIAPYQLSESTSPLAETLNIYAVPRYITPAFLSFIEKIQLRYPKTKFMLHNATTKYFTQNMTFDANTIFLCTIGYSSTKQDIDSVKLPAELKTFSREHQLSYTLLDAQELYACVHKSSKFASNSIMTSKDIEYYPAVSFTYTFDQYPQKYVIDNFEQQKQLIKQGTCFGRYTKREFMNFFSKNYSLIPFEKPSSLFFIAFYPQNTDNKLVDIFLTSITEDLSF